MKSLYKKILKKQSTETEYSLVRHLILNVFVLNKCSTYIKPKNYTYKWTSKCHHIHNFHAKLESKVV